MGLEWVVVIFCLLFGIWMFYGIFFGRFVWSFGVEDCCRCWRIMVCVCVSGVGVWSWLCGVKGGVG